METQVSATGLQRWRGSRRGERSLLRAFRGGATAMAVLTLWQATMAGQFLSGRGAALRLHEAGSYALFVTAVATGVVAAVAWRRGVLRGAAAPVGTLVVPLLVSLQAWAGYARWLALHVPLGVALLGVALWLLTTPPGGGRRRR